IQLPAGSYLLNATETFQNITSSAGCFFDNTKLKTGGWASTTDAIVSLTDAVTLPRGGTVTISCYGNANGRQTPFLLSYITPTQAQAVIAGPGMGTAQAAPERKILK